MNKTSSKAVVRLNLNTCNFISDLTKKELFKNCSSRINKEGILTVASQKMREQNKNLEEAIEVMKNLIAENHVELREKIVSLPEEEIHQKTARL